jgi:hypothetical protein
LHLQIRASLTGEGFRESCRVTAQCASEPDRTHSLIIEVVPSDKDLR